jgi:hypothetical protein
MRGTTPAATETVLVAQIRRPKMKTWRRRLIAVGLVAAVVLGSGVAFAETWSGGAGAGNGQWDNGANWDSASPPANPTGNTITYDNDGAAVTGVVTGDWRVGTMDFKHTTGSHKIDLNGATLTVGGDSSINRGGLNIGGLLVAHGTGGTGNKAVVFTNGTLRLGDGSLVSIGVGIGRQTRGQLDLRQAAIEGGVLKLANLYIGRRDSWTYADILDGVSDVLLGSGTASALHVVNNLTIGYGSGRAHGRIGEIVGTTYMLPVGMDLLLGDATSSPPVRCAATIGRGGWYETTGELRAQSGGQFTGYLSSLTVGRTEDDHYLRGLLLLEDMTNCAVDVTTVFIGKGGKVSLPPGVVTNGTTSVGSDGTGSLTLRGTRYAVTNSVHVYGSGRINVTVTNASTGLDIIPSTAGALTVDSGGLIDITFEQDPPPGGLTWGLRWLGNHVSALQTLESQGRLSWSTNAGVTVVAALFYDSSAGYTYIGLNDSDDPMAVAGDITVELIPPDPVEIGVDDLDGGSYDPKGPAHYIVATNLYYAGGAATNRVVFSTAGVYNVTLEVVNNVSATGTATAVVTVIDPITPTAGGVTWSGLAPTALMDRREWQWADNWLGGVAPTNPTTAVVNFGIEGLSVTGIVEDARAVGTLRLSNTSGSHTIDLGGHTLTVSGTLQAGSGGRGWGLLTNGTVRVGSGGTPGNISVGYMDVDTTCKLTIGGAALEGTIDQVSIGRGRLSVGVLDLQAATVPGGTLRMSDLYIGDRGANWTYPDSRNGISTLDLGTGTVAAVQIVDNLVIGRGSGRAHGRMGEVITPVNQSAQGQSQTGTHKLPVGCDLIFGDATSSPPARCAVTIGRGGDYDTSGELIAQSGGEFNGTMSSLIVGKHEGVHELRGLLELGTMDRCTVDALSVFVGRGGHVSLPPGTATVGTTTVGTDTAGNGRLDLLGTHYSITNACTIGARGTVNVEVGSGAIGLDLAESATMTVSAGGLIDITFTGPGLGYGLRWAGDKTSEIQSLIDDGKITWDDSATGRTAGLFFRSGYTFIGPPPAGTVISVR